MHGYGKLLVCIQELGHSNWRGGMLAGKIKLASLLPEF